MATVALPTHEMDAQAAEPRFSHPGGARRGKRREAVLVPSCERDGRPQAVTEGIATMKGDRAIEALVLPNGG